MRICICVKAFSENGSIYHQGRSKSQIIQSESEYSVNMLKVWIYISDFWIFLVLISRR